MQNYSDDSLLKLRSEKWWNSNAAKLLTQNIMLILQPQSRIRNSFCSIITMFANFFRFVQALLERLSKNPFYKYFQALCIRLCCCFMRTVLPMCYMLKNVFHIHMHMWVYTLGECAFLYVWAHLHACLNAGQRGF